MKKRWLKKALCAGLALSMIVGLSACGGGGDKNVNAALAKENVYRLTEVEIPQFVEGDNEGYVNVMDTVHKDGKIYVLLQVQHWGASQSSQEIKMMTMNDDGSDVQVTDIELPGAEAVDEEVDGGFGVMPRNAIARPMPAPGGGTATEDTESEDTESEETESEDTTEGTEEDTTEDTEADGGEVGEVDPEMPETGNVYENTSYNNFTLSANGTIYGIKSYYYEDYSDPENYVSKNAQYICSWDADGKYLWETEVEALQQNEENKEYLYVRDFITVADGSLNLLLGGDNAYLVEVNNDGTVSDKKKLSDDTATVLASYQWLLPKEDGTFVVIYNDQNDWAKMYMADYDFATDSLSEPVEMPANASWNGFRTVVPSISHDLVYTNNTGVYYLDRGNEQGTKMMDFINSDVNITTFASFVELSDKSFMALYSENYESNIKAGIFTYVSPEEIADKAVIVLAGTYIPGDMKNRVIEYNRTNEEYRIVLKEYESYNTPEDYTAGTKQLNNDIITGAMPDILLTNQLPIENYISKGWIADINKLIEKDEELSQVEFVQNVFDAYSVDEKLYYVIPKFNVVTMVAKESLVGDGSDWSMEKMKQILAEMGENTQAIGEVTRDQFMSMALSFCGRDFVNFETGQCTFDSQEFIDMMEFAKTLPEEINWDEIYGDGDYWGSYESQYRDNKTLLMQMYIGDFQGLGYSLNGYMGEPVTFVGFPMASGKGAYINTYDSMVLSSKSACLEGAWDFVRYYLTDEYQESIEYGLSVNKKYLLEQAKKGTEPRTYIDYETGEEVEYKEWFNVNGEQIELPPLSQEQVDQVLEYIQTVKNPYYYNEDVLNIVNEEMGGFYADQKSAKDTAAIIQSRVQLYVDENR